MPSPLADDLARAVLGEPVYTAAEVAAAAGVSVEEARRLWRALGFPPVADDARVFTDADVATLGAARALVAAQVTNPEVLLQITRVTGQALSRIAEAQIAARAEGGAVDVATVAQLATAVEPLLAYVWRRHLVAAALRAATGASAADGANLVVGFADLVGFTAFSLRRAPAELAAAVDRFEALAYEHIPERGGRVIKMIGDEVMFAVDDPVAAARIGLALVDAFSRDPQLPDVRVGLASGPVLTWQGDLYGPTVNLASRLVDIARPGTVLASQELGLQLAGRDDLVLRRMRGERLKGIGRVRPWVIREKRA
jgi:adenylate cyclase